MIEKKSGIYCIENVENGKRYIGKAANIEKRMWDKHSQKHGVIGLAIKKYGDAIIRYIIQYCDINELDYWEQYYIKEWNTKVPNGYNLTDGGEGVFGYIHTEISKEKIRKAISGIIRSEEARNNMCKAQSGENNPNYGKVMSDERKKKISQSHIGLHLSKETRELLSKNASGENAHIYGTKMKNATSIYYGICKIINNKKDIRWQCRVGRINLGLYKNELEAAYAYDKYVVEHNINRPLNFPQDYPNYPVFVKKEKKNKS
jgi:group I intron endonuclease